MSLPRRSFLADDVGAEGNELFVRVSIIFIKDFTMR